MNALSIARTHDSDLINSIITHPAVYPFVSDDGSPPAEEFDCSPLLGSPMGYFLLAMNDEQAAGVFMYHAHNAITYEVHTNVLPEFRGAGAVKLAKLSLKWMFENTRCRKVVTHVPITNRPAYRLARAVGMCGEGTNRRSFMKDGAIINQHVLGITMEELVCH